MTTHHATYAAYQAAIEELRAKGAVIGTGSIAKHMKKRYDSVFMYLQRHPELLGRTAVPRATASTRNPFASENERPKPAPEKKPPAIAPAPFRRTAPSARSRVVFRSDTAPAPRPEPPEPDSRPGEPEWERNVRERGGLYLVYRHQKSFGIVGGLVTPREYVELWKAGEIGFQIDREPKPEHLPTLEEMEELQRELAGQGRFEW